jgi:diaminohydroxyphosphoribosylaminopyrimidine deaminase/5-amino-6-(5-phosphoribosylamino)uracil reductase
MHDEDFMRTALAEARRGLGHTSPNPAVGAVIVRRGQVVARGFHRRAGQPHAEIEALRALKKPGLAKGAAIYVTLEPCSTHGRTPPCVDAIVTAGFRRVVIGAIDPNPAHAGRGVKLLRDAGIEVTTGVLEEECRSLNAAFNQWIVHRTPLVIAKAGMSLDGRLTRPQGEGQWLTNAAARSDAHRLRSQVDAILVGAETLRKDNPRLTVRGVRGARQPWRVVLTRSGRLPKGAHLFTDEFRDRTLVYRGKSLRAVLKDLGQRQVTSVLIEGGGEVLGEAFDRRLVHRVHFYVAPLLCGGPVVAVGGLGVNSNAQSAIIRNPAYAKLGDNLRLTGEVEYPEKVAASK